MPTACPYAGENLLPDETVRVDGLQRVARRACTLAVLDCGGVNGQSPEAIELAGGDS